MQNTKKSECEMHAVVLLSKPLADDLHQAMDIGDLANSSRPHMRKRNPGEYGRIGGINGRAYV